MNLGMQLKQAQAFQVEALRRAELAQRAATEEATLKRQLESRHFFDYSFQLFEHRLRNGSLPGAISLGGATFSAASTALDTYKWTIPGNDAAAWRTKGKGVWSEDHPMHTVWEEFDLRCKAVGLEPHWTYDHGMGHESHYDLTVVAAPN